MRRHVILASYLLSLATPTLASAQDAWSPIKPDLSKHIDDGIFSRNPFELPFQIMSSKTIESLNPKQPGDDFEQIYGVGFAELTDFLGTPEHRKAGFDIINGAIFKECGDMKFKIVGEQSSEDGKQYRFFHRNCSRDFLIHVSDAGAGRTRVVFKNVVLTTSASGVLPTRAGFEGATFDGAAPLDGT